jgi:hypothetical protein
MKEIAGRETEPAGTVFKNVQVLKDMPAGRFVVLMDSTWGRALNRNCTDCHVANQWASDSLNRKKTARMMAGMVEAINTEQLTKLPVRPGQNPPEDQLHHLPSRKPGRTGTGVDALNCVPAGLEAGTSDA